MNQHMSVTCRIRSLPMRFRCAMVVAALVMLALSGCSGGNPVFRPTITQQHATARVEQILRGTAAAITPRPKLEAYMPNADVSGCVINPEDTADTRVQVTHTYWLRGISERDNASIGEQILRLWKKQGYTISQTSGMGTSAPNINAVTPDDFLVDLAWSDNGALSIEASSPCLWPDGTPPPGH